MIRRLQVLCPQEYVGSSMVVTPCTCCATGWNKALNKCTVDTGAEDLPDVKEVPDCPMQFECRHQLQSDGPCAVRSKGLICESALVWSGLSEEEAMEHPLGFSAITVIDPEDMED